MATSRHPAQNAQSAQFPGPAGLSRPATIPQYTSIVDAWIDHLDRAPWNVDKNGVPVTKNRIKEQVEHYSQLVEDSDEPYWTVPLCVKRYRAERWAWKNCYNLIQPDLAFPGVDPEPRYVEHQNSDRETSDGPENVNTPRVSARSKITLKNLLRQAETENLQTQREDIAWNAQREYASEDVTADDDEATVILGPQGLLPLPFFGDLLWRYSISVEYYSSLMRLFFVSPSVETFTDNLP
ncbi:hypothetical protein BKA65DRAFT_555675 [Rhexocercosporidium sp. MPI-PUGE-AT-0058]|nr:hypothetical protein BKA65DRAFT_555675 [Rhexocercosporidium sp. MPI-PUGE-AT-0058]